MFLNLLLISLATSFSVFLSQAYQNSQNYHNKVQSLSNFDTMSLAAASRVSKESNRFLADLQNYLNDSIQAKSQGQNPNSENLEFLFNKFITSINPSASNQLNETINFVINQAPEAQDIKYQIQLLNSSYLPAQIFTTSPRYVSSLITQKQVEHFVDINSLNNFYQNSQLKISPDLISALVSASNARIITADPSYFGLEVSSSGLDLKDLPNGLLIEISANSEN